ncbi:MAG TPA: bifunctional riboflavin kinase/FMN adenylyltransferase [Bacteroidetes bacterium]|nr:bifunctional riboflavin kinase/FMN adenylyltransferase [Bacteroidota bacterium]
MASPVFLSDVKYDTNTVLTVGTYDGVHEGHKEIIRRVVETAKKKNARSVVVTFDPHPREIINTGKDKIKLLTTIDERAHILNVLGIDEMVVIPFTRDFSLLSSREFIEDILIKKIGVSGFVIGYDHQFGRNREGTISLVRELAGIHHFEVDVIEAQEVGTITVSSTLVRKELEVKGNIELADKYLGRPYRLSGLVVHGDKRGRKIGYPTANLKITDVRKIIPKYGVYAVDVQIDRNSKIYRGMMNIGYRPTFTDDTELSIEVHIIDFQEDLYGKIVTVDFLKRIRDERSFSGIDALKTQLDMDRISCLGV